MPLKKGNMGIKHGGSLISEESVRGPAIPDIYIGLFLLLIIGGIALAYVKWIGHALIAIISLALMIYTLTTGAMLKGRIKRSSGNVFKLHKRGSTYFGALILGSFIYGLWIRLQHGESIISSLSLIHISEPTRQAEISYAVFCLKK